MVKIDFYYLYYTPKGNGRVVFRLNGENQDRATPPLSPIELSALAAVLAQKRIVYDTVQNTFASYDDDNNPLIESNLFV
jgi:hypothetical protein